MLTYVQGKQIQLVENSPCYLAFLCNAAKEFGGGNDLYEHMRECCRKLKVHGCHISPTSSNAEGATPAVLTARLRNLMIFPDIEKVS